MHAFAGDFTDGAVATNGSDAGMVMSNEHAGELKFCPVIFTSIHSPKSLQCIIYNCFLEQLDGVWWSKLFV